MEEVKLSSSVDSTQLVKITFNLNENDWHGFGTESIWAEPISENSYLLCNTPFFAKGVSFKDIVLTKNEGDNLLFESVSTSGGHSTYRAIIDKSISNIDLLQYWESLEKLGCTFESADREKTILYAIDVPPTADIYQVYELLEKGEMAGVWSFEEGHCGHELKKTD